MLKERLDIRAYASDTVHDLIAIFNHEKQIEVVSHLSTYVTYGCYFLTGLVILISATALLRYFFSASDMIDCFSLTKKSAELSLKGVQNNKESLDQLNNFLQEFRRLLPELVTKKELIQQLDAIRTGFTNVTDSVAKEELARMLLQKEVLIRLIYLEEIVKKIMKHVNYTTFKITRNKRYMQTDAKQKASSIQVLEKTINKNIEIAEPKPRPSNPKVPEKQTNDNSGYS